jgi:hypothetical protein
MTTITNQILAAIVTALTNANDIITAPVFYSPVEVMALAETSDATNTLKMDDLALFGHEIDEDRLEIQIDIFVRDDANDELTNPMLGEVDRTSDPRVHALLMEIGKTLESWHAQEANATTDVMPTTYAIHFHSSTADLTWLA